MEISLGDFLGKLNRNDSILVGTRRTRDGVIKEARLANVNNTLDYLDITTQNGQLTQQDAYKAISFLIKRASATPETISTLVGMVQRAQEGFYEHLPDGMSAQQGTGTTTLVDSNGKTVNTLSEDDAATVLLDDVLQALADEAAESLVSSVDDLTPDNTSVKAADTFIREFGETAKSNLQQTAEGRDVAREARFDVTDNSRTERLFELRNFMGSVQQEVTTRKNLVSPRLTPEELKSKAQREGFICKEERNNASGRSERIGVYKPNDNELGGSDRLIASIPVRTNLLNRKEFFSNNDVEQLVDQLKKQDSIEVDELIAEQQRQELDNAEALAEKVLAADDKGKEEAHDHDQDDHPAHDNAHGD